VNSAIKTTTTISEDLNNEMRTVTGIQHTTASIDRQLVMEQ
jgi:hypothetical protein